LSVVQSNAETTTTGITPSVVKGRINLSAISRRRLARAWLRLVSM